MGHIIIAMYPHSYTRTTYIFETACTHRTFLPQFKPKWSIHRHLCRLHTVIGIAYHSLCQPTSIFSVTLSHSQSIILSIFFLRALLAVLASRSALALLPSLSRCTNTHKYLYHDLTENSKDYFNILWKFKRFYFAVFVSDSYRSSITLSLALLELFQYDTVVTVRWYLGPHTYFYLCLYYIVYNTSICSRNSVPFSPSLFYSKTIAIHIP